MASLDEWKPLPGSKGGRYYNKTTGEVISRRQRDNIKFREMGFTSRAEYERLGKSRSEEAYWYRQAVRKSAQKHGITYEEARRLDSRFHKVRAEMLESERTNRGRLKDGLTRKGKRTKRWGPKSAKAKYLVEIGRREEDWKWAVGDTPPKAER